jgi:hypothetical protein
MDKAAKRVSSKGKAQWWVLRYQPDDLFSDEYRGPDKPKARERAQAVLAADPKARLIVCKASKVMTLVAEDLRSTLPKDAF